MTALTPSTTPTVPPAPARLVSLGTSMADVALGLTLASGASADRVAEALVGVARSRYLRGETDLDGFEAELERALRGER